MLIVLTMSCIIVKTKRNQEHSSLNKVCVKLIYLLFLGLDMFSRPGQSQGLLYKHLCNSFIDSLIWSAFVKLSLRRHHGQTAHWCWRHI